MERATVVALDYLLLSQFGRERGVRLQGSVEQLDAIKHLLR